MNDTANHIEMHRIRLLEIWEKAARSDVKADLQALEKDLQQDGFTPEALFNSPAAGNVAAPRDILTQIRIRGHINHFVGLQSGRIKEPADRLAAIEESDRHLAKAFALAKTTSLHPIEQTSHYTLHSSVRYHVQPLMDKLKPAR